MASIVDVDNAPGNQEELIKSLTEAVTEKKTDEPEGAPAGTETPAADTDPLKGTKFEGKSVEDILTSYSNLESAYGRMANDLGTQRKLTDRLLDLKRDDDLQRNAPPEVELPKVDGADLLDNPTEALDRYTAAREARIRQEYDDRLSQFETQLQADRFMAKHPDFMTVGQSDEFRNWAQATPIRNQVAQRAAAGDWDAADALLVEYKEELSKTQTAAPAADAGVEAARNVGLESATPAGSTPDGASSGKVYRRADLIDLKINKPHVYGDPAFQAEILKAYSEGRVK